ncbi:MAG: hypothetical protein KJ718_00525 [Nanoarchaeota archaeon]|nr:hypothetical protein [Nanoarchaeota archaeon]MBU1988499.1 hypothetical protein [Nanoarchaeota archaeon]
MPNKQYSSEDLKDTLSRLSRGEFNPYCAVNLDVLLEKCFTLQELRFALARYE